MKPAPMPPNEKERVQVLHQYQILDTLPEQRYDDISQLAAGICGTPIAFVSLIDSDRQWFKSRVGFELEETPRDMSFCTHAILDADIMIVPDALEDERFADNPLVRYDPKIRFYAGAPLLTGDGEAIGTLCVVDNVTRTLSDEQVSALGALSRQVMDQLELRRTTSSLEKYQQELEQANVQLERTSLTDDVTGFHNTRFLHRRLDELLVEQAQEPVSLVFFDMDKFKHVVDTHGHLLGAKVLREVAETVDAILAPGDSIVRYGGDEFVLVLPGQAAETAAAKVERIQACIADSHFLQEEGLNLRITASFGLATYPDNAADKEALLAAADRCLFRSKATGRNRVTRASHEALPTQ